MPSALRYWSPALSPSPECPEAAQDKAQPVPAPAGLQTPTQRVYPMEDSLWVKAAPPWLDGSGINRGRKGISCRIWAARGNRTEGCTTRVAAANIALVIRGEDGDRRRGIPAAAAVVSWREGSRGVLRGLSPSIDGLVVRVAFPLGEEERAAAHQEHQQRGAQRHGHDGDDKGGEGVLGGLPKAQQHRPAGGNETDQPQRWGSAPSCGWNIWGFLSWWGQIRISWQDPMRVFQTGGGVREGINKLHNSSLWDNSKTRANKHNNEMAIKQRIPLTWQFPKVQGISDWESIISHTTDPAHQLR